MPTRTATWPQGIRWLVLVILAVGAVMTITWVLFVPAADWLAHHDLGSVNGQPLQAARDAARGRLLTLGAGLFAAGALLYTARNFTLSREGQVTDRYTKAIEQLGSEKLDVRIGGIYALERVARDSAKDHPTVVEVLSAFIREHSREQWPPLGLNSQQGERSTRPDVQAAITVIGRRDRKRDIQPIDLAGAKFVRGNLTNADLTGANLGEADLTGADLGRANLTGAWLTRADFTDADLSDADLTGTHLSDADLTRANLGDADLARSHLTGANLRDTQLGGADLTGANFTDAYFHDTDLTGADLTGASLAGAS